MRITTFIFLVFCLHVSARTSSQTVTFSGKNVTLKQIFGAIKEQTGFAVFGNLSLLTNTRPVSISVHEMSLTEFLELTLRDQPLAFQFAGKSIVLSEKTDIIYADQPVPMNIRVTDSAGNPLSGASVMNQQTKKSGFTGTDGTLSLPVSEGDVLLFSYIGYLSQKITITKELFNNPTLTVLLKPVVFKLEDVEVSVNTGYQKIRPEQITGSVYTITAKEYNSRINTTDFLTGLQNKIPGLLINNDVQFEGNNLFQIRGISTIVGNKKPLIVVDGYPTDLTLDMIDPNEIETVTVLKDAAAATIYGARSSNGVIIVERKKARVGNVKVNFRATTSLRPKEQYGRWKWDDQGSMLVADYEKIKNMNASPILWARQKTLDGYSNYSPANLIMNHWRSDTDPITAEERDRQLAALGAYNNAEDYSRLFLRTGSAQTYNLDMSGGTERVLYYLTTNYSRNNATQIKNNDGIFRISGRMNMKLSERFSLEMNTDYQEGRKNTVPIPDINSMRPYERFEDANGQPAPLWELSKATPIYNSFIKSLGLLDNNYYPLTEMNEVSDKSKTTNNRITANFRYRIGNGFNLSFGGVHESSRTDTRHLATENSAESRQLVNYYTKPNTGGGFIYNVPKGAILKQTASAAQGYTLRAQMNYDKQVSKDHSVNVILGAEMRKLVTNGNAAAYFGYNDQTLFHQPIDFKTFSNNYTPSYARNAGFNYTGLFNQKYQDDRFISGYSNLVYAYKGKYSVTGSIRVDQSNLFGTDPKYKYKPLWSVGAAWNIDQEAFMQNVGWVRSLRLRAAHGFNGNVAKDALPQVIASDALSSLNPLQYTPNLNLASYANSGLRWEQTHNLNVGLNYGLFKGISGSIDYYVKKSTDILASNQIDASKGGVSALINQASIRNSGLEVSLQADWINRRKFNWNTGLIFAHNTSKVLQVYNANITATSFSTSYITGSNANYLKGYAVGALFTYRYAGLDNTGALTFYDKNGVPKQVLSFDDRGGEIDYRGSSIPVFNLGLSNRVDIGNFYAYCMINYFGNFKVRVPIPDPTSNRPLEGASNYWKKAGDENIPGMLPAITNPTQTLRSYYYATYSDKYTVNGSYFTLGDLTAAYSFRGSSILRKTRISNLEVKAQASNICTIALNKYHYSVATGNYAKQYLTPTYSAALSVNF